MKNNCNLIERLEKTAADRGIEISSDKSKILVNSIKPSPSTNIWMNGNVLEEVDLFKYLGSTQTKDAASIWHMHGNSHYPRRTLGTCKLSWFGNVCLHDRGRPRKSWKDNINEWTGQSLSSLLRQTTKVDGRPSERRCLSEYPNNA